MTPPRATSGLWRVTTASDSAVLKVVRDGGAEGSRWPASPDPSHPYYWRREPLAYESGLVRRFGAPQCRAIVERADGSVALWLEDVPEVTVWTPNVLGEVARRLGRAQAAPPSDEPWLSRGWLHAYLELHGIRPDERLDELPQTLCHFDFHPGNVLGMRAEVVVDWAYVGLGPVGSDAGVLVADGLADGAFGRELADDATDAAWHGYLAGLSEGGWTGSQQDVRAAFFGGTALRLSWLPRGEKPEWDATIALLDRWRELA